MSRRPGHPVAPERRTPRRTSLLVVAAILICAGLGVLAWAFVSADEPAPLPAQTFSVAPAAAVAAASTQSPAGAQGAPTASGQPNRLTIPALGVSASVQTANVYAHLPPAASVGLDEASDPTARAGSALIAGHVSSQGVPGALKHLADVRLGDRILLTDADGRLTTWVVYSLEAYVKSDLPRGLASRTGDRRLVLVTCGGPVIERPDGRHYRDNVVVYAAPLG